jgi:hypothetical protein
MVDRLRDDLLQAVLAGLPARDVAAALRVSRAFDAAARTLVKTVTLTPANTRDAAGRVRLPRFPALSSLHLLG